VTHFSIIEFEETEILMQYGFFIAAFLFVSIVTASVARKFKTRALIWYLCFALGNVAFGTCELLVILTGNTILEQITYSTVGCIWFICWTSFFIESTRAQASPVLTAFMIAFTAVLHFMAWVLPPEIRVIDFFIGTYIIPLLISSMFIYWAAITYIDSPWFAKKSGLMLFIASIVILFINLFIESLPRLIMIGPGIVFNILIAGVIFKHPGIVSFLPYKTRYLVLLDKHGEVMLEQEWSTRKGERSADFEAERKNLVSLLQHFSKLEKLDRVGAKGIDLEIGNSTFLVNSGSSRFIAGLIAKRSSKALRDGLSLFVRQVDEILAKATQDETKTVNELILALLKERMLSTNTIA
jgi:hypothetical protein